MHEEVAAALGWELVEKCAGGEFGAHLVSRRGEKAVLKVWSPPLDFERISNSAELAGRVRANGQLVPRYLGVGKIGDSIYTLQEWIDGEVPARLELRTAQRMIELLDTHEGVAANWGDRLAGFGAWWDLHDTFTSAPPDIHALAEEIRDANARFSGVPVTTTDVLHDDYHHKNVMVRGAEVVAIIDWDAAQPGDRWFDAFLLMWWSQVAENDFDPAVAEWLRPFVESQLNERQLARYAASNALRQLEFFQRAYGGAPAQRIKEGVERTMAPYWRSL